MSKVRFYKKTNLFYKKKIDLNVILLLECLWLNNVEITMLIWLTGASSETVVKYFKEFNKQLKNL